MNRSATFSLTGEFIAESCGGRLVEGTGIHAEGGASIDSRTIVAGQVFFAIQGERFDGHDYLAGCVVKGAVGLVVRQERLPEALAAVGLRADRVFVVTVGDTTDALRRTATAWVEVMAPRVLAVTGSVGKTTTKDLLRAALAANHETCATVGNLNNLLGLSLTCLRLEPKHEFLVVEMGMNAPGEIADLCTIARPHLGVVTTVAPVHLEGLKTLSAVADAKAELVEALPADGIAVLNADDPRVAAMASRTRARVVTFGRAADADVRILTVDLDPAGRTSILLTVDGHPCTANLSLVGEHHAMNAAAAVAAAWAAGVDPDLACGALASVAPGKHRMEIVAAGTLRVIDDCYNASPRSTEAALDVLARVSPARRVAVLGDMLELGDATDAAHLDAGRQAADRGVECLVAVGRHAARIREGAVAAGLPATSVFAAPDAITAVQVVLTLVKPRDTVLVKGSRGVGLERVVDALKGQFQAAPGGSDN